MHGNHVGARILKGDDEIAARIFLTEKKRKIIDVLMFDSILFNREGLCYLDYQDVEEIKPEKAQALLARLGELTFD